MTTEQRLTMIAIIVAFTSPIVKALADRWIAKPAATPDANTPTIQTRAKSRLGNFFETSIVTYASLIVTVVSCVLCLWWFIMDPLSRSTIGLLVLGTSSFVVQIFAIVIHGLIRLIENLQRMIQTQQLYIEKVIDLLLDSARPDESSIHP